MGELRGLRPKLVPALAPALPDETARFSCEGRNKRELTFAEGGGDDPAESRLKKSLRSDNLEIIYPWLPKERVQ